MNTVIKISRDFKNFVSCENVNAWTAYTDTAVSINTTNAYDGNAALNIVKSGATVAVAHVSTLFPVSDFTDKDFYFYIYISNSTVLSTITTVDIVLSDTLNNTITLTKTITLTGSFTKVLCNIDDFIATVGNIDIGLINKIDINVNTSGVGITWSAGDVVIDGFSFVHYIEQIMDPKNIGYGQDLQTANQMNFTLDIKDESIEYIEKWLKVELYAIENGEDELLWTGQILDIVANFTEVNVICFDEKLYLQKKRLFADKSYSGLTVTEALQSLVEDQYTRNNEHLSYTTDIISSIAVINDMESLVGWSGNADTTLGLNTTIYQDGSGSISIAKTGDTTNKANLSRTISSTNFTGKYISTFIYVNSNDVFNNIDSIEIQLSDGVGIVSMQFDISLYGTQKWITIQGLISDFTVLSPTDITAITSIQVIVNTVSALNTWGNNLLLIDRIITSTTRSVLNPVIGAVQCTKGTSYADVLDSIAEKLGGEWKSEKGRIIYMSSLGEDKTSGSDYVEFFSSADTPIGNSILDYKITDSGRDMATSIVVKTANGLQTTTRKGNTYLYGFLEEFVSLASNGWIEPSATAQIIKMQSGVKTLEIVPDTTKYGFREVGIGDLIRVRVERGSRVLDIDQALKVVQKSVQIANFTATYTITLMTENVRIRNAPNVIAGMQKRIELLEINN